MYPPGGDDLETALTKRQHYSMLLDLLTTAGLLDQLKQGNLLESISVAALLLFYHYTSFSNYRMIVFFIHWNFSVTHYNKKKIMFI